MTVPVAVVTGASSGIGEATARELARRGWRCVLLARREDRLRRLAEELGGDYGVCDVGDPESVARAAAAVVRRHPVVHLLVNNAGIPGRASFVDVDEERLEALLRVNYLGAVRCLRAFLPALEAAGGADVVNVVSVAGAVAYPPSGPYAASKHAQLAFSRAVAVQLVDRGIRVHTVNPGFVETEGFPQATTLRSPLVRRLVVGPDRVARHIADRVGRRGGESFVPAWYRVAAIVQGVAPGLVARALARERMRRARA